MSTESNAQTDVTKGVEEVQNDAVENETEVTNDSNKEQENENAVAKNETKVQEDVTRSQTVEAKVEEEKVEPEVKEDSAVEQEELQAVNNEAEVINDSNEVQENEKGVPKDKIDVHDDVTKTQTVEAKGHEEKEKEEPVVENVVSNPEIVVTKAEVPIFVEENTRNAIINGEKDIENGITKDKTEGSKDEFDLDDILVNEVGQFGRYQLVTLLLAALPVIFSAFASGEYIFTTARIPTRCHIGQCDSSPAEFYPPWVLNAIPGTSATSFEQCAQYANATFSDNVDGTCPAALFDQSTTVPCDDYVYENTNTVVYDFGLACDEWRRSQIGSIRTIGTLLVLPITGYISDRWGRRVALTLNAFNTGWLGLARSFVNSYEWFLALEVLESTVGAGAFSSCYILVTELVGPKYRVIAGVSISTMFAIGQVILGFIAWGVQPWRTLTQVLYAPQLLVVCYFWILSESVRWLLSKGRYEESEEILKKVAKSNKKELSEKSLELLRYTAEAKRNEIKAKEAWLPIQVLRSKVILSRCLVSPIWWITNTLVYYGMNINSVNLSGNQYLNYVAVAAIEIPGYWTAILLLDRIGRKPVLIFFYFLCAACQFGFAFFNNDSLTLALYLIGKYAIATVMTSVYVYTAELYPTKYRHSLFAFSSMIGRLGSITAPLTPALALTVWENFPSVLFGSFALLSCALVFTTPETLGTKLPDTMEEAENLGKKQTKVNQ